MHFFDYIIHYYEPLNLITMKHIRVKKTEKFFKKYFFLTSRFLLNFYCHNYDNKIFRYGEEKKGLVFMNENFSIASLIKIGLTKYEAVIYINLLQKKIFTASEISRLYGTSRSKTYEILHKLVIKGLFAEILEYPFVSFSEKVKILRKIKFFLTKKFL